MPEITGAALPIARISIFVLLFALIFLSAMIGNQIYGLLIGMGTIDRHPFLFNITNIFFYCELI